MCNKNSHKSRDPWTQSGKELTSLVRIASLCLQVSPNRERHAIALKFFGLPALTRAALPILVGKPFISSITTSSTPKHLQVSFLQEVALLWWPKLWPKLQAACSVYLGTTLVPGQPVLPRDCLQQDSCSMFVCVEWGPSAAGVAAGPPLRCTIYSFSLTCMN